MFRAVHFKIAQLCNPLLDLIELMIRGRSNMAHIPSLKMNQKHYKFIFNRR